MDAIGDHAAITVIMCAAAIELYINDCAVRLLGADCMLHIEKLATHSKYILVPRLHCGHKQKRDVPGTREFSPTPRKMRSKLSMRSILNPKTGMAFTTEGIFKSDSAFRGVTASSH